MRQFYFAKPGGQFCRIAFTDPPADIAGEAGNSIVVLRKVTSTNFSASLIHAMTFEEPRFLKYMAIRDSTHPIYDKDHYDVVLTQVCQELDYPLTILVEALARTFQYKNILSSEEKQQNAALKSMVDHYFEYGLTAAGSKRKEEVERLKTMSAALNKKNKTNEYVEIIKNNDIAAYIYSKLGADDKNLLQSMLYTMIILRRTPSVIGQIVKVEHKDISELTIVADDEGNIGEVYKVAFNIAKVLGSGIQKLVNVEPTLT